ncbi:TIR domain-containing protein [Exilibacterium tricleocarpae]|uniref:TIR domain-containing protein n=1 Tax=Exilibacterium tricleocarpae TaxID=2591008 RepID=A0A545TUX8_9GAMM|nr:TIR domain-containing protein [Exilibacterium tricleocarpae]TQV81016.1 TIR domain-containing protein [Exilibacterium tricleocarpae]
MTRGQRDRTVSVLTTVKLQALLDSGLNPTLRNRRALADSMTAGGDKISVHGVEGWFKHVDSNYALARESLHPELKSYPVPRRRWSAILNLFPVDADDLRLSDQAFKDMCFERLKTSVPAATTDTPDPDSDYPPLVFVIYAMRDGENLYEELLWLRGRGLNLWWDTSLAEDPLWSNTVATVIERACVCLLYQSAALISSTRCQRELELACHLGKTIVVSRNPDTTATPALAQLLEQQPSLVRREHNSHYLDELETNIRAHLAAGDRASAGPPPLAAPMPDQPSIVVLPLTNLTGHREVNYVAQGITEDIITLLSRVPELFVISRTASNAYAGTLTDHRTIRERLGVRFALEGSVRRCGAKLRVTAMLTDLVNEQQLWADKFEGEFDKIWDVQDEITTCICARLQPRIVMTSLDYGSRTDNYATWRYWQLGWYKLFVDPPIPALREALDCFHKALEHEPDYALAHAGIANAMGTGMLWGGIGPEDYPTAKAHAETAYRLLPDNPAVLYSMGMVAFIAPKPLTVARDWVRQAVDLEPSNAAYVAALGYLTAQVGEADKGLEICEYAARLAPGDRRQPFINYMLSATQVAAGRFEAAVQTMLLSDRLTSVDFVWIIIGFAWFKLHRIDKVEEAIAKCIALGARPLSLYHYSVTSRLWPQYGIEEKEAYLKICAQMGIR